jgi:hypothetical protein
MVHRTPIPPKDLGCHRTGFAQTCCELVASGRCDRWRSRQVQHGLENFTAFDCVDNWAAQFGENTAVQVNQLGAAVESFRNEVLRFLGYPEGVPQGLPPARGQVNGHALAQIEKGEE